MAQITLVIKGDASHVKQQVEIIKSELRGLSGEPIKLDFQTDKLTTSMKVVQQEAEKTGYALQKTSMTFDAGGQATKSAQEYADALGHARKETQSLDKDTGVLKQDLTILSTNYKTQATYLKEAATAYEAYNREQQATVTPMQAQIEALTGVSNATKSAKDSALAFKTAWENGGATPSYMREFGEEIGVVSSNFQGGVEDVKNYITSLDGMNSASVKATGSAQALGANFQTFTASVANADGTISNFKYSVNASTGQIYDMSAGVKDVTNQQKMMGDSLINIAAKMFIWQVMGTLISAPIRALKEALSTMKEVDSQLVQVRKVTGASAAEMELLEKQAYKTASAYGVAADEYLGSVAEMARAGYASMSDDLAELSVKTQIVGDTDAETANQFLLSVDAAYQYKGSVEKLTEVLDGANEIDNKYATSIEKIAEGLGKVAPIAAQTHVSIGELSAAIGTVTAVTQRSGTEAATALRALFLNIVGDTKTEIEEGVTWTTGEIAGLKDVLNQYAPAAVAAAKATGEVINPMEAIGGLAQSMKDGVLTEQKLMEMVSDIGGKLRTSQLLALIQNWDMYQSMLEDYGNSIGSADKEVANALDSWERKSEQLSNTWTEFMSNLVDTDTVKGALDGLIDVVGLLDTGLGRTAITVVGLTAAIVGVKGAIAGMKATEGGLAALEAIFNPSTLAVAAVVAGVIGAIALADHLVVTYDEHLEQLEELNTELDNANQEYEALLNSTEPLNAAEQHRLDLLKAQTDELKRQAAEKAQELLDLYGTDSIQIGSAGYGTNSGYVERQSGAAYGTRIDDIEELIATYKELQSTQADTIEQQNAIDDEATTTKAAIAGYVEELDNLTNSGGVLSSELQVLYAAMVRIVSGETNLATGAIRAEKQQHNFTEEVTESSEVMEEAVRTADELREAQDALASGIKTTGTAFNEFSENGTLAYSTLAGLRDAFSDVEGIDGYISRLAQSGNTAEDVTDVLRELIFQKVQGTYTTRELADADVNLIAAMLEEAGVTNSLEAATQLVTNAQHGLKAAEEGSAEAAGNHIKKLYEEGKVSEETRDALIALTAQETIFNNTELDVSQKTKALYAMAEAAGVATAMLVGAAGASSGDIDRTIKGYMQTGQAASLQEAQSLYFNNLLGGSTHDMIAGLADKTEFTYTPEESSGGGGSSDTTDPILEALKEAVALRKSELELLKAQDASSAELIEKQKEIQEALHNQAEYMRQNGGAQDEINALSTEWLQIQQDILQLIVEEKRELVSLAESELDLMERQGASDEDRIAKLQEIQGLLHEQAEAMREIGADEEEINAISMEWWDKQEEINTILKDAQEAELERRKSLIALAESELSILEAQEAPIAQQIEKIEDINQALEYELAYMREIGSSEEEINDVLLEQIQNQERLNDLKQALLNELESAVDKLLDEEKKSMDAACEGIEQEIESLTQAHEDAVDAAKEELEGLEEQYNALFDGIEDSLEDLEDQYKANLKVLEDQEDAIETTYDEKIDALDKQLDAITAQYNAKKNQEELEEKMLAIEEARLEVEKAKQALANAEKERTVRYYNAQSGQWEWGADQSNVNSAQEALNSAEDELSAAEEELQQYREKLAFESAKEAIKALKEQAQEEKDAALEEIALQKEDLKLQYELVKEELQEQKALLQEQYELEQEAIEERIEKMEADYEAAKEALEEQIERIKEQYEQISEQWAEILESLQDPTRSIAEIMADMNENAVPLFRENVDAVSTGLAALAALLASLGLGSAGTGAGGSSGGSSSGSSHNVYDSWEANTGGYVWDENKGQWVSYTDGMAEKYGLSKADVIAMNDAGLTLQDLQDNGGSRIQNEIGNSNTTGGSIYQVGANGSAPGYADVGDYIVTAGGTYVITGGSAGNYTSQLVDGAMTTDTYKGAYSKPGYDSGGVLQGMGGIKATQKDEMVLDPDITGQLLKPTASNTFRQRMNELSFLYGGSSKIPSTLTAGGGQSIGSQHNGDLYQYGDITLTEAQARSMSVYDLTRMSRSLGVYKAAQ